MLPRDICETGERGVRKRPIIDTETEIGGVVSRWRRQNSSSHLVVESAIGVNAGGPSTVRVVGVDEAVAVIVQLVRADLAGGVGAVDDGDEPLHVPCVDAAVAVNIADCAERACGAEDDTDKDVDIRVIQASVVVVIVVVVIWVALAADLRIIAAVPSDADPLPEPAIGADGDAVGVVKAFVRFVVVAESGAARVSRIIDKAVAVVVDPVAAPCDAAEGRFDVAAGVRPLIADAVECGVEARAPERVAVDVLLTLPAVRVLGVDEAVAVVVQLVRADLAGGVGAVDDGDEPLHVPCVDVAVAVNVADLPKGVGLSFMDHADQDPEVVPVEEPVQVVVVVAVVGAAVPGLEAVRILAVDEAVAIVVDAVRARAWPRSLQQGFRLGEGEPFIEAGPGVVERAGAAVSCEDGADPFIVPRRSDETGAGRDDVVVGAETALARGHHERVPVGITACAAPAVADAVVRGVAAGIVAVGARRDPALFLEPEAVRLETELLVRAIGIIVPGGRFVVLAVCEIARRVAAGPGIICAAPVAEAAAGRPCYAGLEPFIARVASALRLSVTAAERLARAGDESGEKRDIDDEQGRKRYERE